MPTAEPSSAGSKQPLMHTKFTLNFTSFGFFRRDSFSMPKSLSILCCILAPTPAFSSPQSHVPPALATVTPVTTALRSYPVCPVPQWVFKLFFPCDFFCPGSWKAHAKGPNGFHWPTGTSFFLYAHRVFLWIGHSNGKINYGKKSDCPRNEELHWTLRTPKHRCSESSRFPSAFYELFFFLLIMKESFIKPQGFPPFCQSMCDEMFSKWTNPILK